MSLDVHLQVNDEVVYSANITHNLGKMAAAVHGNFYKALWRPEELNVTTDGDLTARHIADYIRYGMCRLVSAPTEYSKYNSSNGWGEYIDLVNFAVKYLHACDKYPDAVVEVSR
jgi:hypothetical protein